MADKKKDSEGGSVSSAKTTGKKAAVSEAAGESAPAPQIAPRTKSAKIPKLPKKNKARLPRREKKARQKGL